ncbi:uncharacterized protein BDV14DRAFT_197007 [Aspergillus stella-maris]|uniref:uncharacterized protein n=1 Tax=Aspergillus stella-maris TaxID=1810926 RepID=UPI003CCD9E14
MPLTYDNEGIERGKAAKDAEKAASQIVKLNVALIQALEAATSSSTPSPPSAPTPTTTTSTSTPARPPPSVTYDESDSDSESTGSDIPFEGPTPRPPFLPFWPLTLPLPHRGEAVNGLPATDFVKIAHGNYVYMHQFDLVVEIVPKEEDLTEVEPVPHEILDQALHYPDILLFNNMHGTRVVGVEGESEEESEDGSVMVDAATQIPEAEDDGLDGLRRRRGAVSDEVVRMIDRASDSSPNEDNGHNEGEDAKFHGLRRWRQAANDAVVRVMNRPSTVNATQNNGHNEDQESDAEELDDAELDAEMQNSERKDERMSDVDSLFESPSQMGRNQANRTTRATQTVPGILQSSGIPFTFPLTLLEMMNQWLEDHMERLVATIAQERLLMRGAGGFK